MKKLIKSWLLPLLIALGLFIITRPVLAQIVEQPTSLSDYLLDNNVIVGEETIDGYRQIYYEYQGQKTFISGVGLNNHSPVTSGEYIVYLKDVNGAPQVFLYNILVNTTIELSSSDSNNSPAVSREGNVVWEGWVDESEKWQIFLFDGKSVIQLTSGNLSINPYIEGDNVVYARRDVVGEWRASLYSVRGKVEKDVSSGNKTQYPKLKGGKIVFALPGRSEEEFPLTADDILLLDLPPLTATDSAQMVTEQDIMDELNASPSVGIEEATESGSIN